MKNSICTFLVCLVCFPTIGQIFNKTKIFYRGGYCGTTNSTDYFSLVGTYGPRKIRTVFSGFEVERGINEKSAISIGLVITPKGFKTTASSSVPPFQSLTLSYKFNFTYLEAPVGINYKVNKRFGINGGGVVSYLIRSTFLFNYNDQISNRYTYYTQQSNIDHLCKNWDFGLFVGGTMNIYKNLELEARLQKNFIEPYVVYHEVAKQQTFFLGIKYCFLNTYK